MELVQEAYEKSRKTYGYRRVTLWIQQNKGISINHKAVLRLMNKINIRSVARKRKPYKKISQLDIYHRYENILDRDFIATKPNQKWVTDITYILTQQGWAYLSTIKDLFDGFIVAHELGQHNCVSLVTNTLKQAKRKEKVTDELLLHSDHIVPMSFGRGINTLHRHILSLPVSITSHLPCLGVAIVGTMPRWIVSSDTSRKNPYAN